MKKLCIAVLLASSLALAGCEGGSDKLNEIVVKFQEGIAKSCNFWADAKWARDIVTKLDLTLATLDGAITMVCDGLNPPSALGLYSSEKCPKGEIVIEGETICIEGEYIEPKDEQK